MMEYKGYIGKVEMDDDAAILYGEVINIRDVITFEGTSVEEVQRRNDEDYALHLYELKLRELDMKLDMPVEVMSNFEALRKINVNEHTETKSGLTYLSWAWAWDIFKTQCPNATYELVKNENGLPYFESSAGVMVYTKVTVDLLTYEMWLPVMDGANKAMRSEPYVYTTKYGEKNVDAFTMFDINKTIMRCLVKNLAMFGFALYIYSGEDLPPADDITPILNAIKQCVTLPDLQRIYNEAIVVIGDDKPLKSAVNKATAERKNILSKGE